MPKPTTTQVIVFVGPAFLGPIATALITAGVDLKGLTAGVVLGLIAGLVSYRGLIFPGSKAA